MGTSFVIKQHDLLPPYEAVLSDNGVPVDLTTATEVRLLTADKTGLILNVLMTKDPDQVTNPGKVTYFWQSGDTAVAGSYKAEIQVIWPGTLPQTFPADGYLQLTIKKDLGP